MLLRHILDKNILRSWHDFNNLVRCYRMQLRSLVWQSYQNSFVSAPFANFDLLELLFLENSHLAYQLDLACFGIFQQICGEHCFVKRTVLHRKDTRVGITSPNFMTHTSFQTDLEGKFRTDLIVKLGFVACFYKFMSAVPIVEIKLQCKEYDQLQEV